MRDDDTPNGMRENEWRTLGNNDGAPVRPVYPDPDPWVDIANAREQNPWGKTTDHIPWPTYPKNPSLDSGPEKRDTFSTGYKRNARAGKGRYDLLPRKAIEQLAILFEEGAERFGDLNYKLGSPIRRSADSMKRHADMALWRVEDEGDTERKRKVRHFVACAWNALVCAETLLDIMDGELDPALDDRYKPTKWTP